MVNNIFAIIYIDDRHLHDVHVENDNDGNCLVWCGSLWSHDFRFQFSGIFEQEDTYPHDLQNHIWNFRNQCTHPCF
jgi:hypothetical protein